MRHILCRSTPPPPKLNLPLINFGVINFFWISARPTSRGQWYHGLIKLEVTFLKILQWRFWVGYWPLIYSIPLLRNFPYPFTIIKASDNEAETCKQVESPGVNFNPEEASKRMSWQDRVSWVLLFLPCGERMRAEGEQHSIWECRWKICSSDFGRWVRQVAPTVMSLSLRNPWARGSGKRKQFKRNLLSSQRNSLGMTLIDGSYGWSTTNLWQRRTAGQMSKLSQHYQFV